MGKSKSFSNPLLNTFKHVFVGMFGYMSAYMVIGLYSALFVGTGYYIIQQYNKPNTKLFDELQTGQYFGIVLAGLGLLPWIQYFFMSFMFEGGSYAFNSLMSE
tara:strand:+ start:1487 stop:1795 length:309 start_codon:yes stop_codon:yes gene_type:complete